MTESATRDPVRYEGFEIRATRVGSWATDRADAPSRGYVFGTNRSEIEFTQCRVFFAVSRSSSKT